MHNATQAVCNDRKAWGYRPCGFFFKSALSCEDALTTGCELDRIKASTLRAATADKYAEELPELYSAVIKNLDRKSVMLTKPQRGKGRSIGGERAGRSGAPLTFS